MFNQIQQTLQQVNKCPDFLDLIDTNFTANGFIYPSENLLKFSQTYFQERTYLPDSKGLLDARKAIAAYYLQQNFTVDPENIIITASTSEAYSLLFNLFATPGDNILLPRPAYPLFEYLAQYSHLKIKYYDLLPEDNWQVDLNGIKNIIDRQTKFLVLISPNNPTGSIISEETLADIAQMCAQNKLRVISDEVFAEFNFSTKKLPRMATHSENFTTFTLNGISKMFALPDLKLAWIAVNGPESEVNLIIDELETANDTYLNANYLAQSILSELFKSSATFQKMMLTKLNQSREILSELVEQNSAIIKMNKPIAGIHCVITVKSKLNEEEFVIELLKQKHLNVQPGYFYELEAQSGEVNLVISFLASPEKIKEGMKRIVEFAKKS